jgi:hypothetical protein
LFKPCATRAAGTTPALDWRSLAGDKVRDEHVFIVCRYGRMFLSARGDCGRRDCGFTTAATGLERGANVWLTPTGRASRQIVEADAEAVAGGRVHSLSPQWL